MSFGIVGLAIGVGAYFANFDWEHPSQLAAGFGTLVFMLIGFVLIIANLSIIWFSLSLVHYRGDELNLPIQLGVFALAGAMVIYLNYMAASRALRLGAESLRRRVE